MQPSWIESALLKRNGLYSFANMLLRFTQLAGEPKVDRNADNPGEQHTRGEHGGRLQIQMVILEEKRRYPTEEEP